MFKKFILAFTVILSLSITIVSYAANYEIKVVKKQASILAIDFPNKTMNELKQILLEKSKRMALSEIYGEMIQSKTEVKNFVLTHDFISAKAIGIIRIKGTPKYYNGKNFGELCVLIEAFVTQEDLKKFKAKNVVIKRFCLNDPNIPFAKLKSKARKASYIEIIKRHNPSLDNISMDDAKSVIHDFYISNENLDVNTGAYCMDISANIIPIEIDILAGNTKSPKNEPIAERKISNDKLKTDTQISNNLKIKKGFFGGDTLIYNGKPIVRAHRIWGALASPDGKRVIVAIKNYLAHMSLNIQNSDRMASMIYTPTHFSNLVWTSNKSFRIRMESSTLGDYNSLKRRTYEAKIDEFNAIISLRPIKLSSK